MPDWSYFDRPATDVESNMSAMNGRADAAIAQVDSIVERLGALEFNNTATPPHYELPEIPEFRPISEPEPGDPNLMGDVVYPTLPGYVDLSASLGLDLSAFDITIPEFVIPAPVVFPDSPAPLDASGKPDRPDFDLDITIPVAPDLVMPSLGELSEIVIPEFTFPELPTFDGVAPTFDGTTPNTNLIWSEPVYSSESLDDLTAQVRSMLAGGTGLPANIQSALFDAARSREAMTALEAEQGAFDTFAGKGFSMPPGMLSAAVAKAREKSRDAQNTLSRDLLSKAAQWEIENIRVAVEKGLGLETLLVNQFNNMAQRTYEAAKFRVESDLKLFDVFVNLFNAKQGAFKVLADVFQIKTTAALATLEVFKAQIQAAIAKGQLNEQVVKVYQAQLQGVTSLVEVFKAKMQGAQLQSDVVKNLISAYGEDVKAWAAKIGAEKERFAAYYELMHGKSEQSRAIEWQARAYEATLRGLEAKGANKIRFVEAKINAIRASVDKQRAGIEYEMGRTRASLEAIQARSAAFSADTQRYTAEIQGLNESRRVSLSVSEQRLRNNLAYYEALLKEYDASQSRLLDELKIKEAALDAAARTTAAVAAGAMSAIHVQASVHGNASISDSASYNVNHNFQDS